ncbi:hypothetical protein LX66_3943 [Chitinophaga japonensis]|uniref:Uncharacterized protein n=1 Tax=Chitinophaga japonensis TaxID=104662 RepID=A0A562T181_CHIJA|nr:hypothetical protein LX66_3943 [Chitinophaga japonensis]
MKKAKIMLTAVGLLAVVGGALAFKAHRASGTYFCSTTTSNACPIIATTNTVGGPLTTTLYCTQVPSQPCTTTVFVRTTE